MRDGAWDPSKQFPWPDIKEKWEQVWDMSKPILLEKSPPNLVRALEIQQAFEPAYFIAIIRDPYAFCEGRRRRHKSKIAQSAEFWVKCANYQLRNIKELDRVTYFRYEDFAGEPERARAQILAFMPELLDLDVTRSFKARSVQGSGERKIYNFNREKMDRLSAADIRAINSVLKDNQEVMDFYRYAYVKPSLRQTLTAGRIWAVTKATRLLKRAKGHGRAAAKP